MKCEVIRDLMPLYLDECCSESSRELVEEHLKECDSCRKMAEQMRKELIVGTEEKQENLREEELLQTGKEVIRTEIREDYLEHIIWMDIPLNILLTIFSIGTFSEWDAVNNIAYSLEPYNRMSWGPELLMNMYGCVGTPFMLGMALYGIIGEIWYLLNARKKRETAILTCVAIQSVLFKAMMFIIFALVGICLIFEQ